MKHCSVRRFDSIKTDANKSQGQNQIFAVIGCAEATTKGRCFEQTSFKQQRYSILLLFKQNKKYLLPFRDGTSA